MAVNPYVPRNSSSSKSITPWSTTIELAASGKGCDSLFNLYTSLGDRTAAKSNAIVGTNTITTLVDGPEKVVRYGELEIGDGTTLTTLTASERCKGLVILCDKLTVKNNATLHMTGKGCRVLVDDDPFYPFDDYKIPFRIALSSSRMSLVQALATINSNGLAPWDRGTFQHLVSSMFGFDLAVLLNGIALMTASGCGASGVGGYTTEGAGSNMAGGAGGNGSSGGTGGGGGGAKLGTSYGGTAGKGGVGNPYSGGSGGGGNAANYATRPSTVAGSKYSGPGGNGGGFHHCNVKGFIQDAAESYEGGGGAGNPPGRKGSHASDGAGGSGCGGKLTIICRGAVSVVSGGKIEANGMPGGASGLSYGGGGGSGGGHISIIAPSFPGGWNGGTVRAIGGAGGSNNGGAGGNGNVNGDPVLKTFTDMGW